MKMPIKIDLVKKSTVSIKKRAGSAKVDVESRDNDIKQATQDVEDLTKRIEEPCEPPDKPKEPKKERKARGTGKKKVQLRPPRRYKPKDLKRIARKVVDDSGNCPNTAALVVAAVGSEVGLEHWIDILIRILGHIHEIYVILHNASDYRAYSDELLGWKGGDIWMVSDIIDAVIDFAVFVLSLPRELVLLLKPVDDFVVAVQKLLIKFRSLIISFL